MMLNLKYLETFIRVADAGSFNKAADRMFITPSALIKQIRMLEEEVGAELFVRTHRGLYLSESGKSLYQDGRLLLDAADSAVRRAADAGSTGDHVIRIGTSPVTPADTITALWEKAYTAWPQLKMQIVPFQNTPSAVNALFASFGREIDLISGVTDPVHLKYRHCSGMELQKYPVNIAVPFHHPYAGKASIAVSDLLGQQVLLMSRGKMEVMDRIREELSADPAIRIVDFDFYGIDVFNRCEREGALLVTMEFWMRAHPGLKMIPADWDYQIPYGLLYPQNPSDKIRKFLEIIR